MLMSSITTESTNGASDPVADHPVIKQLVADVAQIKVTLIDMQQSLVLMRGLVERFSERQEHVIAQNSVIVDFIKARGDTGALEP